MGADCLECPTIRVIAPPSWTALDQCIGHIDQYHWLVFTSVNGVHFFFERLFHQGMDARALGHLRTAAIGPATQEELLKYGITTDILPETYQAESVVDAFSREDLRDKWVLLPRAMEARAVLPEELTRMGAKVNEVTAYQTVQASDGVDQLIDGLRQGRIDMVTFTSSSTAKNFKALLPEQHGGLMKGVRVASIGPITAETALSLGFESTIVASEFTISGLCSAIVAHYTSA
jgi:uroporphyrinogen III methyltransferase/synthase